MCKILGDSWLNSWKSYFVRKKTEEKLVNLFTLQPQNSDCLNEEVGQLLALASPIMPWATDLISYWAQHE